MIYIILLYERVAISYSSEKLQPFTRRTIFAKMLNTNVSNFSFYSLNAVQTLFNIMLFFNKIEFSQGSKKKLLDSESFLFHNLHYFTILKGLCSA